MPLEAAWHIAARRRWLKASAAVAIGWAATCSVQSARASVGRSGISFYDNFVGMHLLDQAGRPLRLHGLRGKVVLFNFIFTACSTVCPVQVLALRQMLQQMPTTLRAQLHLVSVSLDPLGDTPQSLKAFAKRYEVDHATWSFVTGKPADIERLAETLALFRGGKGKAPLEDHSTALWLADAHGALVMRYAGNPPDAPRIAREMAALVALNESSQRRPASSQAAQASS